MESTDAQGIRRNDRRMRPLHPRTHQRTRWCISRTNTSPRSMTCVARTLCAWSLCLCAALLYHRPPSYDVHAFGDGWSSRRRTFAPRALVANRNALSHARASALSTRRGYLAIHTYKGLSSTENLRRDARVGGNSRSDGRSLHVCFSTISEEAVEVETVGMNVSIEIDGANGVNGANGENGASGVNEANGSDEANGANEANGAIEANGVKGVNGHHDPISISGVSNTDQPRLDNTTTSDIPTPTANGGFTHTSLSRAKISAANKGKTPWNKGKARSDEVKARIAEGVRRKNREKFLAKLAEEGITEEEYNERKKTERRKKDAERRARRTAKGGYTPTEETKKKISKILKEKYANGEVQRKPRDPSKVRRGFKHSEETKQKIRDSLKRKWAEDTEYRELMTNKTVASGHVGRSVRKRISETLKKRWEDPDFRANMMEKFANRKASSGARDDSHRKKISEAMKRKWMDEEYRKRATEGMAKGREREAASVRMAKPLQPKMPMKRLAVGGAVGGASPLKALSPVKAVKKSKTSTKTKRKTTKAAAKRKTTTRSKKASSGGIESVAPITSSASSSTSKTPKAEEPEPAEAKDGSISRLREERRDLYDLLYGDEESEEGGGKVNGESNMLSSGMMAGVSSNTMAALLADDDDLDDFDPYGLH